MLARVSVVTACFELLKGPPGLKRNAFRSWQLCSSISVDCAPEPAGQRRTIAGLEVSFNGQCHHCRNSRFVFNALPGADASAGVLFCEYIRKLSTKGR